MASRSKRAASAWIRAIGGRHTNRTALSTRDLDRIAARFKVLAEPARLQVLQCLRAGPQHVGALIDAKDYAGTDPYGVPILDFEKSIEGQAEQKPR